MGNLGRAIRETREKARISQGELARRCGADPSTVSRIEAGEREPSVGLLLRLVRALDTTVAALLRRADRAAS